MASSPSARSCPRPRPAARGDGEVGGVAAEPWYSRPSPAPVQLNSTIGSPRVRICGAAALVIPCMRHCQCNGAAELAACMHLRATYSWSPPQRHRQVQPGQALLELDSHLVVSVSHTTRAAARPGTTGPTVPTSSTKRSSARWSAMAEFFEVGAGAWQPVRHLARRHRSAPARQPGRGAGDRLAGARLQIKRLFPERRADLHPTRPAGGSCCKRLQRRGEDRARRDRNSTWPMPASRWPRPGISTVIISTLFRTATFSAKTIVHSQRLRYAAQRRHRPRSSPRSTCFEHLPRHGPHHR